MPEFLKLMFEDSSNWLPTIIDVVIVYYLVYVSLLLVRGTRTVPMALGLLLLILLYVASSVMGLATTYMILDQLMAVVAIFILIIFQDDIRRALIRVGKFAWFARAKETRVMEEVIRAASAMAAKRIGAIIVFERSGSLAEFIVEPGTKIEATVSRDLLYAIFIPKMQNPLHDGAAIIEAYQIREAGTLLPLSANPKIEKTLGTRHRAAIGITEETDAVAVVVSEERGTISLCFNGLIMSNLDANGLRKALLGLFSSEKVKEGHGVVRDRQRPSDPPLPRPTNPSASVRMERAKIIDGGTDTEEGE